ncbi:Transposase tnp2 [Rhynchospora pubera]|uniref:Transposase tnp2 n=1 Tax=Rhynchospora pubera TaxID=906938 RepID=A0AAV8E030_9POAL|nr:Transposase tnp2 [Rhynchospora pubera]
MYHPANAEAWKIFDQTYPEFASEPRNVRLGLATDGFAPFSLSAAQYTCWPVVCYPLNLPPNAVMKRQNMFLTLVIPGPEHPGRDIDVFLQPLIDELEILWSMGIEMYDVSLKQNFNMKAALAYTVNDFPAYSVLSGWGTSGAMSCPCCMDKTKAFWLEMVINSAGSTVTGSSCRNTIGFELTRNHS